MWEIWCRILHTPLGHHCQVGGRPCNCTGILLILNSNVTGRRLIRLAQHFPHSHHGRHAVPKRIVPSGVKPPPSHDIVTQTPPLHVEVAESVQSVDAEHVVTTAAVAAMVLPVKGTVKDIAAGSSSAGTRLQRDQSFQMCQPCVCRCAQSVSQSFQLRQIQGTACSRACR